MRFLFWFFLIAIWSIVSVTLAVGLVLGRFSPEQEFQKMLLALSRVRNVSYDLGWSTTSREEETRVTTTLYAQGSVDLSSSSSLWYDARFHVVRLGKTGTVSELSGTWLHQEGSSYLSYDPPGPDVKGVDFEKEGTWVAFAPYQHLLWGSLLPGFALLSSSLVEEERHMWAPNSIQSIRELFLQSDIFSLVSAQEFEVVQGASTRIFDMRFDKEALRSFLRDIVRIREGRELQDEQWLFVEQWATYLESLSVRFWVGTEDHLLYQAQMAGLVQQKEGSLIPVDFLIQFSDYNNTLLRHPPNISIPFSFIYQQISGSSLPVFTDDVFASMDFSGTQIVSPSFSSSQSASSSDVDEDGLIELLEIFYGTDHDNPDTDEDGVLDGEEVLSGTNPRGKGSLFGFGVID